MDKQDKLTRWLEAVKQDALLKGEPRVVLLVKLAESLWGMFDWDEKVFMLNDCQDEWAKKFRTLTQELPDEC